MIGIRMMKPASKNTGIARIAAAISSAMPTRFGPRSLVNRPASESAPPDISMILPSIEPRATSSATEPRVPPTPAMIAWITPICSGSLSVAGTVMSGRPAAMPTMIDVRISAKKACTLKRTISRSSRPMPARPISSRTGSG